MRMGKKQQKFFKATAMILDAAPNSFCDGHSFLKECREGQGK